jgi:hypothetical protein
MCGNIGVLIVDIIGFATQSLNSINICEINLELQIKVFTLHFLLIWRWLRFYLLIVAYNSVYIFLTNLEG